MRESVGLVAHLHERCAEIVKRIPRKIADLLGLPRPFGEQPVERGRKPAHLVQALIGIQFNPGA